MITFCEGCESHFEPHEIGLSVDGKLILCEACDYAYEANLDNKTGGDDDNN